MSTGDGGPRRLLGLRGATTVMANQAEAIVDATVELLEEMLGQNDVAQDDLVSIVFTATPDLTAEFPAVAARRIGISGVPLLCACEIDVPGGLPRCVRILMHLYTKRDRNALRHIYLKEAQQLPADLSN